MFASPSSSSSSSVSLVRLFPPPPPTSFSSCLLCVARSHLNPARESVIRRRRLHSLTQIGTRIVSLRATLESLNLALRN